MKKIIAFLAILVLGTASLYAQSSNDSIYVEKVFLGHKYYQADQEIRGVGDMKAIVANDELALKEVKKAGVTAGISYVFSYVGGFAMGWQLANLLWDKFNPYVFAGGVGAAAIGVGLAALADNQMNKGVAIYNGNLGITSYGTSVEVDFGFVPGGVGMTLSF